MIAIVKDALDIEHPGPAALQEIAEDLAAAYVAGAEIADAHRALSEATVNALKRQWREGDRKWMGPLISYAGELRPYHPDEQVFAIAASRRVDKYEVKHERARKALSGTSRGLEKDVTAALTDPAGTTPAGIAMAAQIVQHVAAMKPAPERLRFMLAAVRAGDLRTVSAVVAAWSICPARPAELRPDPGSSIAKFAPVAGKQLAAVEKGIAMVELGRSSSRQLFEIRKFAFAKAEEDRGGDRPGQNRGVGQMKKRAPTTTC
jgi:hypothetical protein